MSKFSDHFNSTTIRGRANVAKVTYASFAAIYLYNRFKKSKKKPAEVSQTNEANLNNQERQLKDNGEEHFKCPHCDCDKVKDDFNDNELQEPTPSKNSHSTKPELNQDSPTAKAESMIKSSKTKSYYGATPSSHGQNNGDSPAPDKGSCP
ncbi:hypothetical protein FF38_08784 [Lucilia cuprina]|uniref:Uncharacterized protein n=1 Tax=Lucilia cuprina TaxID=7375 RepID=A0A0L0BS78_LUCCU|nr:hypothetical protein FF38_08784 [Lucilia cuprina]